MFNIIKNWGIKTFIFILSLLFLLSFFIKENIEVKKSNLIKYNFFIKEYTIIQNKFKLKIMKIYFFNKNKNINFFLNKEKDDLKKINQQIIESNLISDKIKKIFKNINKTYEKIFKSINKIKEKENELINKYNFLNNYLKNILDLRSNLTYNELKLKIFLKEILENILNIRNKEDYENIKSLLDKIKNIKIDDKELKEYKHQFIKEIKSILKLNQDIEKNFFKILEYFNNIKNKYLIIEKLISEKINYYNKLIFYFNLLTISIFLILIYLIFIFQKRKEILREKENYLKNIINNNIPIVTINEKGFITDSNKAFCRMFKYSKEEIIGKNYNIICFQKDIFCDYLINQIKKNKNFQKIIKTVNKEGNLIFSKILSISFDLTDKKKKEYFLIHEDITNTIKLKELIEKQEKIIEEKTKELKNERDKAIESSKAKSEFLANMSHEIRTPLNAIIGFINLLKENKNEKEKIKYIETIEKAAYELLNIINDILDFSKIEKGCLSVENINFNPKKEFNTLINLYQGKLGEKNLTLIYNINELPDCLNGDPLRIKQVINNLLSNAIKFTPENKNIYLNIEYKDGYLNVSVKDEGIGITKEYLKKIFSPFSQEDTSTTRKYGGTGLGLAISYNLVKMMKGELKVESEKGKGSCFCFSIPLKICNTVLEEKEGIKNIKFSGKVLMVEDNKANQMFMNVMLKSLGFEVDIANDGVEALEKFKNNKYDLILMDENMPNMNGIEATKRILEIEKKKNLKHTPIIAVTANALKGDREKFLAAGMDDYISKPVKKEILIKILKKTLKSN